MPHASSFVITYHIPLTINVYNKAPVSSINHLEVDKKQSYTSTENKVGDFEKAYGMLHINADLFNKQI
jgi:hypothetical protein